ncbi:cobalt transporter [Nostoc linckia z18]|jgi:cobalt/nickel transport system permease protein|uniref:Cobalt transporter n=2 Tax=Nostoc linckia TaxID=92942 RepID=A0A9Q5ZEY9_NOSLI|nr:cobalt ECF transporter T component CbiQ [Nostoc linckia]PHK41834.1 cobalt transporter [Nostoc linckia z15]PHK47658.1 cobalt transporter [Nostoc linckia z16]PHJ59934.1 cobalt transporter [Nostoc linckia z1]PHJ67111.1 cobalt transporter [Nostoc linckia z3]PHJ69841.1 cobalt transporter [Nostoc linckia z2]
MSLQIDTLAYTNRLRRLPPEHKLIFAFTTLAISLASHPLVQILIVIWMSIWTVIYAKIPAGVYFRLLMFTIVFCLTSLPALMVNGVAIPDLQSVKFDSWYGLTFGHFYIYISHRGTIQAWEILTRALASVSCLYFLMLTVPFTEILRTLRYLRFPILLTDLLLLMYRFIFILLNTANELWTAQNSRGGYRTVAIGMKSLAILIGQLLQRTLQRYSQFSLGLEARGFVSEFRVWHPHRYRPQLRYIIEAIFGCVVLIGLDFWRNAGIFTRI